MPRETLLTPNGLDDLKDKIERLSTVRRREVAARIKEAREFGDISENSEYDDAKNEQAMLEKQIAELEEKLRNARIIDEKNVDTETVAVGALVHVKDQKTDKSTKFKIVGSAEADPAEQQALERVAGRQGADRPQARRRRLRAGAARTRPQAEDHQDRGRLASCRRRVSAVEDDRRQKLEQLRADGVEPFPHAFPGVVASAAIRAAHGDLEDGAETDAELPGGRSAGRRGAATAARRSSTSSIAPARSRSRPSATCWARSRSTG